MRATSSAGWACGRTSRSASRTSPPSSGIYSVFALGFVAGGPPMIWSIVIAGLGQLLVALVFAEIVAQFPVAGGIYPWARRLIGRRWAWLTGWIYGWALIATIASVSTGAVIFRRLAVRLHAVPVRDGADRVRADAAVPGDQPQRHQDTRPSSRWPASSRS